MPKKFKQSYHVKPQAGTHPSLQSSQRNAQSQTSATESPPARVNDILSHLRKTQARPTSHEAGPSNASAEAAVALPFLFPPSQHDPSTLLTPQQRMAARARSRRHGISGPPPPPSWAHGQNMRKSQSQLEEDASRAAKKMNRLPGLTLPEPGSLRFMALRKLAMDWTASIHVYNGQWLSIMPPHLKSALLAFLLIYGPSLIRLDELDLLFFDVIEGLDVGTGVDSVTHAHLGFAINPVTCKIRGYKDLARFIFGSDYLKSVTRKRATNGPKPEKQNEAAVPDSWDADEEDAQESTLMVKTIAEPRFRALTHLSFAHANFASWKWLLQDLTPYLRQLTHLSLAYWPQPCLLPNSRTSTIRGPAGDISVSATGYYNGMDGEWGEAASIIERLGKDMICLKWLDLEGCSTEGGWVSALTYEVEGRRKVDWINTFRGLETLKIGQGYVPSALSRYGSREDFVNEWATWACGLLRGTAAESDDLYESTEWLKRSDFHTKMRTEGVEVTALEVRRLYLWLEREDGLTKVQNHIQAVRRDKGVAQKLNVEATPYPNWAQPFVKHQRRDVHAAAIDYNMIRGLGLTKEELKICIANLHRLLTRQIFGGRRPEQGWLQT